MEGGPLQNHCHRPARKFATKDVQGVNLDERLELPVDCVEMGGVVIVAENSNDDAEKPADPGRCASPATGPGLAGRFPIIFTPFSCDDRCLATNPAFRV